MKASRLTNDGDVDTTGCKRTTGDGPAQTILEDPSIELLLGLGGQTEVGGGDTLEDVVVVLGGPEYCRRRVGHIPDVIKEN